MILYNVTVSIDPQIHEEWLNWMRTVHIPEVIGTKCFQEARISRIEGEEEGGMTYSIMYFAASEELYKNYKEKFAATMQKKHTEKYQGKFAAFRTILKVIEEFK